ncbi:beta-lactamase regulator AmpE [Neptunicella sp. SCSIO 80796]|uniref:beta-lactamase regulator AmpE n=1 Tax=Neptunicella plasticusilytica TaxID=3117012 RepID=UPI003A4E17B1
MILVSLLLVLALERVTVKSPLWCFEYYFPRYMALLKGRVGFSGDVSVWKTLAVVIVPALLLQLTISVLNNGLLELLVSAAVLMICIGCPKQRAAYKNYLQAANRGDTEACCLYAEQLGHDPERGMSVGQTLVWVNYRFYSAVIIWFAIFGAPGALLYVLSRNMLRYAEHHQLTVTSKLHDWVKVLDWVPVRITTFGFVFMGHFSKAFPVWMAYLVEPEPSALKILSDVGKAAEETPVDENDLAQEPCTLVRLAKRNLLFILVLISLLTLGGLIS